MSTSPPSTPAPLPTPLVPVEMLPGESAHAYEARCIYFALGATRSMPQAVAHLRRQKGRGTLRTFQRWSYEFAWVERAAAYDMAVQALAAEQAKQKYMADLADYQQRYIQAGKQLYNVSMALLGAFALVLKGKVVIDQKGQVIPIPGIELNQNALVVVARTLLAAGDLEGHGYQLEELLGQLSTPEAGEDGL